MKKDYAWRSSSLLLVLCMVTLAVLTSCGGGKVNVGEANPSVSSADTAVAAGATQTVTEDEISSLPAWQQDLLSDPGWSQPPIPVRADTPLPAPTYEMLLDWQAKAQANGIISSAAHGAVDGKSSSWVGGVPAPGSPGLAEYNIPYDPNPAVTVPYGCKDSVAKNGHMKEKKIALQSIPTGTTAAITYVEKGVSSSNHFNATGGSSNTALCAVYQIWSNKRLADPTLPYASYTDANRPIMAELSYRADGGVGAGGPCNAAQAYTVRDFIWWKYNQQNFNALPGMNTTALYNILIAPSSNVSSPGGVSAGPTTGRIQNF